MPGNQFTDEQLIRMLQDLAEELGRTPSYNDVGTADSTPAGNTYFKRFGTYRQACLAAGLEPNEYPQEKYSREDLLRPLVNWVQEHGELPHSDEFGEGGTLPSVYHYQQRFGGLRDAHAAAMVWALSTTVEVLQYGTTEKAELAFGEELTVCGDTMVVSVRNNQ